MTKITQVEIVKEYFVGNPKRNIAHPEVVDWVTAEYTKRTGKVFRDPDRAIRKLSQEGFLKKIAKGIYHYDPDFILNPVLEDFTTKQKQKFFRRDGYRCVMCGRGLNEGHELHADHIKAKDKCGKAEVENGQTLCSIHNFRKKNYGQTESGKKMFITLYKTVQRIGDEKTIAFTEKVLSAYEEFDVNGHIEWKK